MILKLFRYNENFYIFDGRIDSKILNLFSLFGIIEKEEKKIISECEIITSLLYISKYNVDKIQKALKTIKLNFEIKLIEDTKNSIYCGEKNEETILDSIIYFIDNKGNYIYILENNEKVYENVDLLINHPFYSLSSLEINNIPKIEKKLYLKDFIFNTKLPLNDIYSDYIYSNSTHLDLYKIINRILLSKKSA